MKNKTPIKSLKTNISMRFSIGLLDYLFGKKVTMSFGDGRDVVVSERWLKKQEEVGNAKRMTAAAIAKKIVKFANYSAIGLHLNLQKAFPELKKATADTIVFFNTISMALASTVEFQGKYGDQKVNQELGHEILKCLAGWNEVAALFYDDLEGRCEILSGYSEVPGMSQSGVIGRWLFAGIFKREASGDGDETLAESLGLATVSAGSDFWERLNKDQLP